MQDNNSDPPKLEDQKISDDVNKTIDLLQSDLVVTKRELRLTNEGLKELASQYENEKCRGASLSEKAAKLKVSLYDAISKLNLQQSILKEKTSKVSDLKDKIASLKDALVAKDGELSALRDQLKNLAIDLRSKFDNLSENDRTISKLQEQIRVTELERDDIREKHNASAGLIAQSDSKLADMASKLDRQRNEIGNLNSKIDAINAKNDEAVHALSVERDEYRDKLTLSSSAVSQSDVKIADLQSKLERQRADAQSLSAKIDVLTSKNNELENLMRNYDKKIKEWLIEKNTIEARVEARLRYEYEEKLDAVKISVVSSSSPSVVVEAPASSPAVVVAPAVATSSVSSIVVEDSPPPPLPSTPIPASPPAVVDSAPQSSNPSAEDVQPSSPSSSDISNLLDTPQPQPSSSDNLSPPMVPPPDVPVVYTDAEIASALAEHFGTEESISEEKKKPEIPGGNLSTEMGDNETSELGSSQMSQASSSDASLVVSDAASSASSSDRGVYSAAKKFFYQRIAPLTKQHVFSKMSNITTEDVESLTKLASALATKILVDNNKQRNYRCIDDEKLKFEYLKTGGVWKRDSKKVHLGNVLYLALYNRCKELKELELAKPDSDDQVVVNLNEMISQLEKWKTHKSSSQFHKKLVAQLAPMISYV